MTPAEFDTRRRLLGLSVEEAASFGDVSPRTYNNWIRGETPLPDDAVKNLIEFETKIEAAINKIIAYQLDMFKQVKLDLRDDVPTRILLHRYRTKEGFYNSPHASQGGMMFGAHAIFVGKIAAELKKHGITVQIEWGD